MNIEQEIKLAHRWALLEQHRWAMRGLPAGRFFDGERLPEQLTAEELDSLLAWIREYMNMSDAKVRESKAEVDARRVAKGMPPTTSIGADRDSLVLSVAVQLDLVPWQSQMQFSDDELAAARALCDLAWSRDCARGE